jgi:MFS family permease
MSAGLGLSLWRLKFNAPVGDLFLLGAALSILLGAFSLILPATPPTRASSSRFAFGKAIKLLKNPSFMALIVVGTVASAMFDYYYLFAGGFLSSPRLEALKVALPESYFNPGAAGLGIPLSKLSAMMTIAQVGELLIMLCLPWLIRKIGIKWVLAVGLAAWPIRYALFVFFPSSSIALLGLFIHGLCIPCFLIAGFMYTEQVAPSDIRASAQSLFLVTSQGIGRAAGALMAGYSQAQNTTQLPSKIAIVGSADINKLVDWQSMFIVPLGVGLACALVFPFVFKVNKENELATDATTSKNREIPCPSSWLPSSCSKTPRSLSSYRRRALRTPRRF